MTSLKRLGWPVSYRLGLVIVLAGYVAYYLPLLIATNFLPYALDNNESFSSFWHASNIWHYGVSKTFGLTDESFSPVASGHPVVEPHNGNFPRFFSLLLYSLGARHIEWQVGITTFTVGTAVIIMAYLFFSRIGNPLFAAIVVLVMLSDFVFFGQWQANTWRVWAGFFFFSTMLTIPAIETRRKRWLALDALNVACLFYLEVVFAAFVAALACVYLALRNLRSLRTLIAGWLALGFGAVVSLSVLFAQRFAYFGVQTALHEILLTYSSRNDTTTGVAEQVQQFYANRPDVAFWYNSYDGRALLGAKAFVKAFVQYNLRPYSLLFILVAFLLAGSWALGFLCFAPGAPANSRSRLLDAAAKRWWAGLARPLHIGHYVLFLGVACVFLLSIADGNLILGETTARRLHLGPIRVAVALAVCAGAAWCLARLAGGAWSAGARLPRGRLYAAVVLLLGATAIVQSPNAIHTTQPLWQGQLGVWLPVSLEKAVAVAVAAFAVGLVLVGSRRVVGDGLPRVALFLVSGGIAYLVVYRLVPGYLMTGYLQRYAPFAVYLSDCVIGLALYVVLATLIRLVMSALRSKPEGRARLLPACALTGIVALSFAAIWGHLQATWISDLKPNQFNTLRARLQQPPFKGASFVVNNYPALAAAYTGQWAYLSTHAEDLAKAPWTPQEYVWLADRQTNPAYKTPDYFLCMLPETMETVVAEQRSGHRDRCTSAVRKIVAGTDARVVARDTSGDDSWAIVKLNLIVPR